MNSSKFIEISGIAVKQRKPYFVECEFCGRKIEGDTPEEVVEKARLEKWMLYTEKNWAYCQGCVELLVDK